MSTTIDLDVIIFGGGIAGLWSLARLQRLGYSVVLLESQRIGGTQTLASQGIIHGGTKYALTGRLTNSAQAIGAMPGIWRACLAGTGELDLSAVKILAQHQCLWSTGSIGSTLTGLLASRAMHSRVVTLDGITRPTVFQDPRFHGQVYRLDEPVLDMLSLTQTLFVQNSNACLRLDPNTSLKLQEGSYPSVELNAPDVGTLSLRARRLVFSAGAGNQALLNILGRDRPTMQLRPLHMLVLRGQLPPLYAHCLGIGASPRLTITSHPLTASPGESVWYIGGQIAESGVPRTPTEQIASGQQELAEIFPWLDLTSATWASWRVDRAEPRQISGLRPDHPFLETRNGVSIVWPTKLAFAPVVGTELINSLTRDGIRPSGHMTAINWPHPLPPLLPWEQITEWV